MHAVILDKGDDIPEVYVFNDRDTAVEFEAWLIESDPDNDGSFAFAENYASIVEVQPIPPSWNKSL